MSRLESDEYKALVDFIQSQPSHSSEQVAIKLAAFVNIGGWVGFRLHVVTIGRHQNAGAAEIALRQAGVRVSSYGRDMIRLSEFAQIEQQLTLLEVSAGTLGYHEGITHREACSFGQGCGWKMCSAEATIALSEQYRYQCTGACLFPVMPTRRCEPCGWSVFALYRDIVYPNERHLHAQTAGNGERTKGVDRLLYLLP